MRRRGFTLLENLVVVSLTVLLLTLTWQVLSPSLRIWKINQARADIEQTGQVVEYKMAHELLQTSSSSVTIRTADPPAISFLGFDAASSGGYDQNTGKAVWRKFVVYYLDTENHILYRKEWPNTSLAVQVPVLPGYPFPTQKTPALSQSELQQICSTENGTEKRAAYYVLALNASNPSGGPFQLGLQLTEEDDSGVELALRQVDLHLRN